VGVTGPSLEAATAGFLPLDAISLHFVYKITGHNEPIYYHSKIIIYVKKFSKAVSLA
jgi:hypothetical protein